MKKLASLAFIVVALAAGPASAHDIWLTTVGHGKTVRAIINYGHPGDRPPPLADKVVDISAINAERTIDLSKGLETALVRGSYVVQSRAFSDGGHTLLATRYDNGGWVKRADGSYRNASKRLIADAAETLWSLKFAKTVTGKGAPFDRVLGHMLEIVPLSDPAGARPGETLRVRVLFKGTPLADGEVERGDGLTKMKEEEIPKFKTDKDGIASIPIVKAGAHLLAIDHKTAPTTPDAGSELLNATLWFAVARR